jgi:hypothetical protein
MEKSIKMINDTYRLKDYATLAYEFAIRNPRVIELLGMPLSDDVVKELLNYGIDATSEEHSSDGDWFIINTTSNLFLDYKHLEHLNLNQIKIYNQGVEQDWKTFPEEYQPFRGERKLIHPKSKNQFIRSEDPVKAIQRISHLIEARGKKLSRLFELDPFKYYDAVTYFDKTVYSLDTSKTHTKTINSDIKFISEWIDPQQYLQLLPKCAFLL